MSLLTRGQAALIARQQAAAVSGNTITYRYGGRTLDLTGIAWTGRTVFASNLEGGARIEFGDRDYLVPVAQLVDAAGNAIEPALGHRIEETIGGVVVVFEVLTPDTGDPDHRFSDQMRTLWRIHTKQVKTRG